jgi:hypothetical protein
MPRNHILRVAAVLCLVLLSSEVRAQATQQYDMNATGNRFYYLCVPQKEAYSVCVGYVIGLTDGLHIANGLLELAGRPKTFCMPSSGDRSSLIGVVTGPQSVDIIMGFLQRNPQRRHELTAQLIIDAFKEAFPCR